MVTPDEIRLFALDCMRWAERADNASHRELMLSVGRRWMNAASAIERRFGDGARFASVDLRSKLD